MSETPKPRERWASATVHLWADEPLDADSEWDEQKAEKLRDAFTQIDLSGIVQRAVDAAIAGVPELIACRVAAFVQAD
ncbi:hypothetical protein [Lamprocystis purpurea]|jgi:hypothetical protein|uniref:hypothetical protein n=1 Tax=Lamprocystis purpurea TaxID=61598 RepID=UPI00037B875B|nr:hypothetical protein [Lamprocystis purpurea]MBV5346992.1 hypothetical protein [bacterium]